MRSCRVARHFGRRQLLALLRPTAANREGPMLNVESGLVGSSVLTVGRSSYSVARKSAQQRCHWHCSQAQKRPTPTRILGPSLGFPWCCPPEVMQPEPAAPLYAVVHLRPALAAVPRPRSAPRFLLPACKS